MGNHEQAGSAVNEASMKKCNFCENGIVSEEVHNEQLGVMPSFCKNCSLGREKYETYINTPEAQEKLAKWKKNRIEANFKKS